MISWVVMGIHEDEAGRHEVGGDEMDDRVVDPTPNSYDGPTFKIFSSSDFWTPQQPPAEQQQPPVEEEQPL